VAQGSRTRPATISHHGIAAAAAAYLLLALTWSMVTPAQWGTDESSNVAYGYHLAHGRWPTIDHPKADADLPGLDERLARDARLGATWRRDIWTAHQPPLYYALAGAAFRTANAVWDPTAGMLGARVLTVVLGLGGVLATGWLALVMVPSRPHIAVLASGIVALIPTIPHYAGQVYADVLVFCLCTVAFGLMASIIRDGPTDRSVLTLIVVWVLLALTKSTGAIVVAAGIVTAAGWWTARGRRQGDRSPWRPNWRFWAAAVVLLAVATSPYAVNLQRYGDPIGSQTVIAKVGRTPSDHPWFANLLDPQFWLRPLDLLMLEISDGVLSVMHKAMTLWKLMLLEPLLIGLIVGCSRLRRRPVDQRCLVPLAAQAVGAVVLIVLSAVWIADGGMLHARYFFPVVALAALGMAYGCDAVERWRIIAGAVLVTGLVGATVNLFWLLHTSVVWIERSALEVLPTLIANPWPLASVTLALAGVAVIRLLRCYAQACRIAGNDGPRAGLEAPTRRRDTRGAPRVTAR
jgi:hypothetical protein